MCFNIIEGIVTIEDSNGNGLSIGHDGRIYISKKQAPTPTNGVAISNTLSNILEGYNCERSEYLIPNKWRVYIQKFFGGSDNCLERSSVAYLYYAPNGSLDGNESLLSSLYLLGSNTENDFDSYYDGDGTKEIIAEIKRLDKGERSVFSVWNGYRILLSHTEIATGTIGVTTATTLTDSSKTWTIDALIGDYVTIENGGCLEITDNDATSITFSGNTNTGSSKVYKIVDFI
jgi:hypothetical protein